MAQLTDAQAFPLAKRTRIEMPRHCCFLLFHAVIVRQFESALGSQGGDGQAIKGRGRNVGNVPALAAYFMPILRR